MTDVYDLLVQTTRDLAHARYEAHAYRGWFRASLDTLHAQQQEIERQRRQLAALRDEIREMRAAMMSEAA